MMLRLLLALVIAGGVLATGCRVSQSSSVEKNSGNEPAKTGARKSPASNPADAARVEAHARYAAGIVHALAEEPEPALNDFYMAVMNDPANVPLAMEVSQAFIQAGQIDKALKVLASVTNQPGASADLFARLATLYFQLGRTEPAATAGRTALKMDPQSPVAYQILTQIFLQIKQPQAALELMEGALKVSNTSPELLIASGELLLQLEAQLPGQKNVVDAQALEAFKRVNSDEVTEPDSLLRLAEGFNALGKFDEAALVYTKLLTNFPELPQVRDKVRAKLADIFLRLNDRQRAADLLKLMIRDNPTDSRAYYFLGSLSYEQTNLVQAAECYRKTILLNPDFEPAYGELASVQLALNNLADAQATLSAARQKYPRSFAVEYLSGIAASRQKNYTNAVQHFTTAEVIGKATDPKRLQEMFYFQFGSACERLGDLAQAEKYFEICLKLAPNFDEAQNYLGFMWAEHGTNLDRAHDLIEKALQADPKSTAYLDSMAWVLFKLNRPREALEFELKALAGADEEDAEIYNHLGDIRAALGQIDEARKAWQKSLALEPDEEVRKKLEAK